MTDPTDTSGYVPHGGMSYVTCPLCGNGEFTSPPQSVPIDCPKWTYEYLCARCGHMIGMTVLKN